MAESPIPESQAEKTSESQAPERQAPQPQTLESAVESSPARSTVVSAVVTPPLSKAEQKAARQQARQAEQSARQAQKQAEKQAKQQARQAAQQARQERYRHSFVGRSTVLGLRLAGLAIASSLAAIGGITVASFVAAPPAAETPWLERGLSGTAQGLGATLRLPQRLLQGLGDRLDPPPQPQRVATPPVLSEAQRQQLSDEASGLRQALTQLNQQADAIEQQLGYRYGEESLDRRLAAIAQTLADPGTTPPTVVRQSIRPEKLVVTLPTDPLFEDAESALKPGASALLSNLLTELRPYSAAMVTVSVHTDNIETEIGNETGSEARDRDLSLRRAQVIASYLRSQLGDAPGNAPGNRFVWNPIGAGNAQPLASNGSNENRQRNRRVEIIVTPQ